MGNVPSVPGNRPISPTDPSPIFHNLDGHGHGYLTLKDLMNVSPPGLMMPHSLPALYFFDQEKNGRLTEEEFSSMVHFCQCEKRKLEEVLSHDKDFRDLILRASKAGVKDCSMHGRSSFRRLSSYSNVRCVYSTRRVQCHSPIAFSFASNQSDTQNTSQPSSIPADSSKPQSSTSSQMNHVAMYCSERDTHRDRDSSSHSQIDSDSQSDTRSDVEPDHTHDSEYSSTSQLNSADTNLCLSDSDLRNPQNRTAVDVAVLESIINANIHKLADLLHKEGCREKFMAWLWELADFNSSGVVTLEELRVFLSALSEDGIDLCELAFHRERGEPLEVCIMNEFDTTHAGLLSKDEFMVLADLVTREYEFWENRHLERIGDYELGRTIGRGSSGIVRLAFHVENRQKYAIKIIKKGKCSDLSRLDREIASLMAAKHQNIVELEEVLDSHDNIFIVMELCGGGSMVDIVRLYPKERMPEETARFFVRQFFEALDFCHRNGICHRDVRLDNLMLDNAGNVKITDFGHSGIYTPGWDLFSTSLVGSVYNLSPEQILGKVYSGEKIDVWSAGVAVYCLLVGRPPFLEPDVNSLLELIITSAYDIPDFVSESAADLIQCMIRAPPEERIPIRKMLHHPWFYGGPEYGPAMDVVAFPVDAFFRKRSDIAEMILAMTIYEHNLHFHLADTQNPTSSPEELRGQDWTLRCHCPRNDIKFTVSLFTKKPHAVKKKKVIGQLSSCASVLTLYPPVSPMDDVDASAADADNAGQSMPGFRNAPSGQNSEGDGVSGSSATPIHRVCMSRNGRFVKDVSGLRPPLQRKANKVTPMNVAAHIRASTSVHGCEKDPFDFEPDGGNQEITIHSFQDDWLKDEKDEKDESECNGGNSGEMRTDKQTHSRSQSLDGPVDIRRINRSATVDAFPYQKVYPQRKMPESVKNLDFGKPDLHDCVGDVGDGVEDGGVGFAYCQSAPITPTFGHGDVDSPMMASVREREIAEKLCRHPSKAVSPQSPQIGRGLSGLEGLAADEGMGDVRTTESTEAMTVVASPVSRGGGEVSSAGTQRIDAASGDRSGFNASQAATAEVAAVKEMEPFIEVRLQGGESGLFLKICRKLKTICTTKLTAAAERQRKKTGERRSLTALRRTASARNIVASAAEIVTEARQG